MQDGWSQEYLNSSQVCAVFQMACRGGMAQAMRLDVFPPGEPGDSLNVLNQHTQPVMVDTPVPVVGEQIVVFAVLRAKRKPLSQCCHAVVTQEYPSGLPALAVAYQQGFVLQVCIVHLQVQAFSAP